MELGEDAVALEEGGVGQVPAPQVQQPGQLVQGRHHHSVQPVLGLIRLVLRREHFTHSNFALELHGGVVVRLSGGLLVLELH